MRIDVLTIFPELFAGPFDISIIKRAKQNGLVDICIHNIRDYAQDKHKRVDDYAFSGEAGMVLMIEPIDILITKLKNERKYDEIVYVSADGEKLKQKTVNYLSTLNNIIILCGHYKGVDQRVRDYLITIEISIGDYVLTGGELPAAVIIDAVVRLIPGAISDETSALSDSFQDEILSPPVYTRPADYKGWKVPEILLSGNSKEIEKWKESKAVEHTKKCRPELLGENID